MSHNISYFDQINTTRANNLNDIQNAHVKSFWKSTIIDLEYFNSFECDVVKEILMEEYLQELSDKKAQKSNRLTKIKLISALPEDADYISVSYGISHAMVPIKDSIVTLKHPNHSNEQVINKYNQVKNKLNKDSLTNEIFSITKWV